VDELDTAKEKVAAIQTVIEEMEAALGTGFNYATPTAATGASGTSGGSSATSEGTSTATASVAAPAGGTTTDGGSTDGTTTDGGSTDGTTSDGGSTGGGDVTEAASSDGASVDITASTPGAPAEAIGGAGVLGETAAAAEVAGLGGGAAVADAGAGSVAGNSAATAGIEAGVIPGDDLLEDGVLGERMAPLVEAVENGTFSRGMMFTEDGLKINILWWLVILAMGAKGVQMYVKSRKKAAAEEEDKEI
ncbi:MAG: hypothetical protein K6E34_00270, partial [Lachnospiraceae bacterium]|nr:hypothetical protein [Lachnospiraceae bacterium]